ncbi:MAG: hypothetical protein K2Q06_09075 [Parvularculaceae bacterium]|nr:hypothetical protein [Parvularculaceae bacterium]
MTDEKVAEGILKFVWQVEGGASGDSIRRAAVARHWLDEDGRPTSHGRQLIDSFEELRRIERDLM